MQFPTGMTRKSLGLTGEETFDIPQVSEALTPGAAVSVRLTRPSGQTETIVLTSRIDTRREADWVRAGGILPYVLHELGANCPA